MEWNVYDGSSIRDDSRAVDTFLGKGSSIVKIPILFFYQHVGLHGLGYARWQRRSKDRDEVKWLDWKIPIAYLEGRSGTESNPTHWVYFEDIIPSPPTEKRVPLYIQEYE